MAQRIEEVHPFCNASHALVRAWRAVGGDNDPRVRVRLGVESGSVIEALVPAEPAGEMVEVLLRDPEVIFVEVRRDKGTGLVDHTRNSPYPPACTSDTLVTTLMAQ